MYTYLYSLYRIIPTCHLSQICLHKFGYVSWTTTYWRDKENKNIIYLYVMLWNLLFISILYKTHKTTEIEEYLQHNPPFFSHPSIQSNPRYALLSETISLFVRFICTVRQKKGVFIAAVSPSLKNICRFIFQKKFRQRLFC